MWSVGEGRGGRVLYTKAGRRPPPPDPDVFWGISSSSSFSDDVYVISLRGFEEPLGLEEDPRSRSLSDTVRGFDEDVDEEEASLEDSFECAGVGSGEAVGFGLVAEGKKSVGGILGKLRSLLASDLMGGSSSAFLLFRKVVPTLGFLSGSSSSDFLRFKVVEAEGESRSLSAPVATGVGFFEIRIVAGFFSETG